MSEEPQPQPPVKRPVGFQPGNKCAKGRTQPNTQFDVYQELERTVRRMKAKERRDLIDEIVRKRPELLLDALVRRALKDHKTDIQRQLVFVEVGQGQPPSSWTMPDVDETEEGTGKEHGKARDVAVLHEQRNGHSLGQGI